MYRCEFVLRMFLILNSPKKLPYLLTFLVGSRMVLTSSLQWNIFRWEISKGMW
jgi:hypothetical protein